MNSFFRWSDGYEQHSAKADSFIIKDRERDSWWTVVWLGQPIASWRTRREARTHIRSLKPAPREARTHIRSLKPAP